MAEADIVVLNGRVLTMDPTAPRAEALAIAGGKIVAVGADAGIRALAGPATRIVDAGGGTVLPGLIDSHVHLFQGSAELEFLSVGGLPDLDAVRAKALAYAAARPDEPLIQGVGAFYSLFDDGSVSPRERLDAILPDRPFALLGADLHTAWANTAALDRAGLLHGWNAPEGSEVVMGADGLANGTLTEAGAFGPVLALSRTGGRDMLGYVTGADPVPPATPEQRAADKALLLKGLDHCAAHGITTLHNMDGNLYQLELLSELEQEGRLKCRVQIPFHLKNFDSLDRLDEAVEMHARFRSDMVWSGRVKMFMDGVMESRTALMSRPYPDSPDTCGYALFEPDHFNAACVRADAAGLQISVHAIGDLAVRRVLDGYAAAQAANGVRDARHRIEHIEITTPEDIARMKALGVVASMQPRHATYAGFFEPPAPNTVMHPDQYACAYPWSLVRGAGIPLAFSTDWPVVPLDALENIRCAVAPGALGPQWPDHSQSLVDTLESYTRVNAWMAFHEGRYGQLVPGQAADVTILGGDIEATPGDRIPELTIAMTLCDGRITFDAAGR